MKGYDERKWARPSAPSPTLEPALWFAAVLGALQAGLIDEVPEEAGLNPAVVAALRAVADWDLDDEWAWVNTPTCASPGGPASRSLSTAPRLRTVVGRVRGFRGRQLLSSPPRGAPAHPH
jgi:hypothetical protein